MNDFEIIELAARRVAARISGENAKLAFEIFAEEMLTMKLRQSKEQREGCIIDHGKEEIPF